MRRVRRGKMDLLRFYLPHDSTGKISTHKAALTAFGFGVRGCVCRLAAAVAAVEVCSRAVVRARNPRSEKPDLRHSADGYCTDVKAAM